MNVCQYDSLSNNQELTLLGKIINRWWDGSPGLVVMGGDSCPRGYGFESHHQILDGHFLL